MPPIYLFYPSSITGGAEVLLKTVAECLIKRNEVKIVDTRDGWLASNTKGIPKLYFAKCQKIKLNRTDILITTSNFIRYVDQYFDGDGRVLVWAVHPYGLIPQLPKLLGIQYIPMVRNLLRVSILRGEYKYIRALLSYLSRTGSIYAMDGECSRVLEQYYHQAIRYSGYLPIVVAESKIQRKKRADRQFNDDSINALWLGRLDHRFKASILIRVMKDLNEYAMSHQHNQIRLNIIGKGPAELHLRRFARKLKALEVQFLGEVRGLDLSAVITETDVGFAMGTSAIEIAVARIPTVLLDFSYSSVSDKYRYRWIYNSTQYILGRSIDAFEDKSLGNELDVAAIIRVLKENWGSTAERCYEYAVLNHSTDGLEQRLEHAIDGSEAILSELTRGGFIKKPFWYQIKKWLT